MNFSDVVINEIAWMGTMNSANDEWIELYNNTESPINLDGWVLKSDDGTPEINLSGIAPEQGFYLLERTDDTTVPDIAADLIYKGALENSGEHLKLYDNLNNIIDEVNCSGGWFAGDNKTKQTMERINPLASGNDAPSWQNSQSPGGTPKTQNSILPIETPEPTPESVEEPKNEEVKEQTTEKSIGVGLLPTYPGEKSVGVGLLPTYPSGIVFNEILPSAEGPDETEEWIELYNQNNLEADVSGWKIKDGIGATTTYTFPNPTKITASGYLILTRPVTKITLNNTEDELALFQPDNKIVDKVNYNKAPRNQSYNRVGAGWQWSNVLTPGAKNVISKNESAENISEKDERGNPIEDKKLLASLNKELPKPDKFEFMLLVAAAIAVLSTTIFYFLKKRLKNNY